MFHQLSDNLYIQHPVQFVRRPTVAVTIGNVPLGSAFPVRSQSMTNTPPNDVAATVAQCVKIADAGGDYVRVSAPSVADAQRLALVKEQLQQGGHYIPLIADIHFQPKAAETAATIVEKVRINPGNYIDKKQNKKLEYTDEEYAAELANLRKNIRPLLNICRQNKTAIRIGTNHGSLSQRIMSHYGDTPQGMVEATMEFLRVCVEENFYDVVISLKASNTRIMVQATRLLVWQMTQENMRFPLHLGVTEAGNGAYGRIKSAIGTGALLSDGIGDTIRVSLTESPEKELPVCHELIQHFEKYAQAPPLNLPFKSEAFPYNPFTYQRRKSLSINGIGNNNEVVVVADLSQSKHITSESLTALNYTYNASEMQWVVPFNGADFVFTGNTTARLPATNGAKFITPWTNRPTNDNFFPLIPAHELENMAGPPANPCFVLITETVFSPALLAKLNQQPDVVLVFESHSETPLQDFRARFFQLYREQVDLPVILKFDCANTSGNNWQIKAAANAGALLIDGLADGLWLAPATHSQPLPIADMNETAFAMLQAARLRTTKTEYISCPSCGRTLFDLETVTEEIRAKTSHLRGLKIGIMGCIVNGPGEMADADYGYVGAGKNKVHLYKNKILVKKNIPAENAVGELVQLIKKHDDWKEI